MEKTTQRKRGPLLIGPRIFSTQREATEHFQALFGRYAPGEVVIGPDHDDLLALTERHPDAGYMFGPGIDHFRIKLDEYGTGRTFTIHWIDGEWTLISYRKCISGQTPHRTQVRNAFRPVIARDIEEWRRAYFRLLEDETGRVPCAISGVLLRPGEGQVDHIHPDTFSSLVDRFLERLGLDYDDVRLRENWDGHIHRPLEDETLGEAFRIWHGEVARLRFIRTDLNRSLGARPQMPEQGSRSNAPAGAA